MGKPKFSRKKYETPSHPWQEERIKAENELLVKYGLKNKREVWKAETRLRKYRSQARSLLAKVDRGDPQAKKESKQLLMHLTRLNILPLNSNLDDVLALNTESILSRRLQTITYLKGFSKTPRHARQLIVHGHITISGRKVTVPSYLVTKDEENEIAYAPSSPLNETMHPERPKADYTSPEGKIKEIPFGKEKEIQRLTEQNLREIFGLEFVKTEVSLGNLRIDTLAFDKETNSFVIIEYKKDKNFSVIDQGYAYLALLLNNKADFILEYNECKNKSLKRDNIDWSQSRVMFISPQFTRYQRQAINFKDLPIELWEVKRYENNTIAYNQLRPIETVESITKVSSRSSVVQKVSREVKVYTEEDHLRGIPDYIKEIYEELKERILNMGNDIEIRPRKYYIGFIANTNFVDIHPQKSQIKMYINLTKGKLDDPKKMARDVSNIGHWGNGDYEIIIKPKSDLDYVMTLVKQSYKKHSS